MLHYFSVVLTSEPEIETPQIDNQSAQPQESDARREKDVVGTYGAIIEGKIYHT